jgi:hypothetical protein
VALAATVVIASIVGAFDAVLLIAIPSLFVWAIAGALSPPAKPRVVLPLNVRGPVLGAAVVFAALVLLRTSGQIAAMSAYTEAPSVVKATRAALFDPGSYRINIRLARAFAARGECKRVRQYAGTAAELFPNAAEPKRLLQKCGVKPAR